MGNVLIILKSAEESGKDVSSHLLFNLYTENVSHKALENIKKGIKVTRLWINIRSLVADNMDDLQCFIKVVGEHGKRMGQNIIYLVVIRQPDMLGNVNLTFDGSPIERVNQFKYLGI